MEFLKRKQELLKTIAFFGFIVAVSCGILISAILDTTEKPEVINLEAPSAFVKTIRNPNIVIIDVNPCKSCYSKEHLPNAVWGNNPAEFYGTTVDILVYCETGEYSLSFANQLLCHTNGNIYNLEGGMNAWKEFNFPVEVS